MPLWKHLIFVFITAVIVLFLIEAPLAVFRYFFDRNQDGRSYVISDPVLHHVWNPGFEMLDNARSEPYVLKINHQGFVSEREYSKEKPKGVFRIIQIGDSNTQGVVASPLKMATILEKTLNTAKPLKGIDSYEVLNLGTTSWSFILYYLAIKNKVMEFNPDLVVVNIDMTDFGNDVAYFPYVKKDESGDPIACIGSDQREKAMVKEYLYLTPNGVFAVPKNLVLRFFIPYLNSAYYIDRFLYVANLKIYEKQLSIESIYKSPPLEKWNEQLEIQRSRSLDALLRIINFTKSKKLKLLVTSVPHYPQFTGERSNEEHALLESFVRREAIPFLNGYREFLPLVKNSKQSDFYWSNDPTHFNIRANELWARMQYQKIYEEMKNYQ